MKIALLCGGPSLERGISLNSARSILDHLEGDGIEIVPVYFDHNKHAYSISTSQLYSNTPSDFDYKLQTAAKYLSRTALKKLLKTCDLAFPAIHGQFGEDGGVQKLLEACDLPYVGSPVDACKLCFDKFDANEFVKEQGFFTLPSELLKIHYDDHKKIIDGFFKKYKLKRAIVKPATGGSSIGVFSVTSPEDALVKVKQLFSKRMDTRVVIEPFCEGIEFTVIVLQNRFDMPVAVLPTEMEMTYVENQIFDYRRKYLPTRQVRYHCPPRFSNETVEKIQVQAEQLFTALGMRDFARFDGWLMPDGNIWFSDLNPISGMEQNSFLFQQASRIGLSHRALLRAIVKNASRRSGLNFPFEKLSMKKKKPVRVIFGGNSSERQVSLMSGTNAWLKLRQSEEFEAWPYLLGMDGNVWRLPYALTLNHTVEEILENCISAKDDEERLAFLEEKVRLRLGLEEYDEPFFLATKQTLKSFISDAKKEGAFVFLGLHGGIGEDGTMQKMLTDAGVKFNGSGQEASALCMNKYESGLALAGLEKDGIYSAPKVSVALKEVKNADEYWVYLKKELKTRTIVVKPIDEGCSSGIVRLFNAKDLKNYVKLALKGVPFIPRGAFKNQKNIVEMPPKAMKRVMFEAFIETDIVRVKGNKLRWKRKSGWIEMTAGVLEKAGNYHSMHPSLTVSEGEVLTVEEKFQGGTGVNLTPPPEKYVKPKALKKVMKSAEKVAKGLGIEGYCRVDIFVNVDNGDVIVIEINTTPALTPSTVLYHQALCEKRPIFPREFIETLVRNKGY